MHIGLIGGIGPGATDHYYRGLIERHARAHIPLELTIAHADVREMARNLDNGDARRQAAIFARLVERLAAAGARLAAITSVGGHFCVNELAAIARLPVLSLVPLIDAEIRRRKLSAVGIIGTRTVMETRLYGAISSARVILPMGGALEEVHRCYLEMALAGEVTEAQRSTFFSVGRALCAEGAEAIVLGGTDLFLAFRRSPEPGFPTIDCADLHVDALYEKSISG